MVCLLVAQKTQSFERLLAIPVLEDGSEGVLGFANEFVKLGRVDKVGVVELRGEENASEKNGWEARRAETECTFFAYHFAAP